MPGDNRPNMQEVERVRSWIANARSNADAAKAFAKQQIGSDRDYAEGLCDGALATLDQLEALLDSDESSAV